MRNSLRYVLSDDEHFSTRFFDRREKKSYITSATYHTSPEIMLRPIQSKVYPFILRESPGDTYSTLSPDYECYTYRSQSRFGDSDSTLYVRII